MTNYKVGDFVRVTGPSITGRKGRIGQPAQAVFVDGASVELQPQKGAGLTFARESLEPWVPMVGEMVCATGTDLDGATLPIGSRRVTGVVGGVFALAMVDGGRVFKFENLVPVLPPNGFDDEGEWAKASRRWESGVFVRILDGPVAPGVAMNANSGMPGEVLEPVLDDDDIALVHCIGGNNEPGFGGWHYPAHSLEKWEPEVGEMVKIVGPSVLGSHSREGQVLEVKKVYGNKAVDVITPDGESPCSFQFSSLQPARPEEIEKESGKIREGDVVRVKTGEESTNGLVGVVDRVRDYDYSVCKMSFFFDEVEKVEPDMEPLQPGKFYRNVKGGSLIFVGFDPWNPEENLAVVKPSNEREIVSAGAPSNPDAYIVPPKAARLMAEEL